MRAGALYISPILQRAGSQVFRKVHSFGVLGGLLCTHGWSLEVKCRGRVTGISITV